MHYVSNDKYTFKEKLIEIAKQRIQEQAMKVDSYKIVCESGKFRLKLYLKLKGKNIYQICKHPNPFDSKKTVEDLRDKLIGWGTKGRGVIVEHILLRPKFPEETIHPICPNENDPYSFRLTVVMPGCGAPYNTNVALRNYADRVIREETPAHLLVNILWVKNDCFDAFEAAWHSWLKANEQENCTRKNPNSQKALANRRSDIIGQLKKLRNTYPPAMLHDWEDSKGGDSQNPVRLGETSLGGCSE